MAAITSAQAGDWNNTATWTGGVIPVSGDTVTISHAVTVPFAYTAVCGTSPTSDAGTVALTINAAMTINGTLQWQGPVRQGNATVTVGAGGTITYDASGAADPAAALYAWQIAQNNSQANAKLVLNGTSGSHCTVDSVSNHRSGGFGATGTGWTDGGRLEATFTDFSYQGAATSTGNLLVGRPSSGSVIFDDCTIDNCGQIQIAALGAAATLRIQRTRLTNPANTSFSVQVTATTAKTTGSRQILNSDLAGRVYILGSSSNSTGFELDDNIIRVSSINASSLSNAIIITTGALVDSFENNLLALITGQNTDPNITLGAGTYSRCYLYRQVNPSAANDHPIYFSHQGGDFSLDRWCHLYTGTQTSGDWINSTSDPTVDRNAAVTQNVFHPNAAGLAVGSLMLQQGAITQDNAKWRFDHNTVAIGASGSLALGVCAEAGATWPAGTVTSIRSNLLYRNTSGSGFLAQSHGTATLADAAITVADYNWTHNVTGDIYTDADAKFGTAPGANDGSGDPQFNAPTRSLLTFDQGYLGNAVATAWATSTSYAVGDAVSNSDSAFFDNLVVNWRCVEAHTSGSTSEPAAGATWSRYWEPAAIKLISDSILAGTTYSGGTNSLIGELIDWDRAGHRPTNSALSTAAHDGTTPGAVQYVSSLQRYAIGFGGSTLILQTGS